MMPKIPKPTYFGNTAPSSHHQISPAVISPLASRADDECCILDLSVSKKPRRDDDISGGSGDLRRKSPVIARPVPSGGYLLTSPARGRTSSKSSPATTTPSAVATTPSVPVATPTPAMSPAFMAAAATAMAHYEQQYAGTLNDVPAVIGMMCTLQALSGYPPPDSLEFVAVVRSQMAAIGICDSDTKLYLEIFAGYCG